MSAHGMVLQAHKRKEPADDLLLVDRFSAVAVSPLKKSRMDYQLYPVIEEEKQFISPFQTPAVFSANDQTLSDSGTPSFQSPVPSVPVTQTASDEKAIVLYRPMNAHLFPGGPAAGSTVLPMKLNTLLPYAGFRISGNNSILFPSSDKFHHGLLKHSPSSSCSLDDSSMEQNEPSDSSLAIVPWLASPPGRHSSGNRPTSQATLSDADPGIPEVGESLKGEFATHEESMQIDDEGEDMAIEEESSMLSNPLPAQCANYVSSFNRQLWQQQHCGYLETPYTPVMWST